MTTRRRPRPSSSATRCVVPALALVLFAACGTGAGDPGVEAMFQVPRGAPPPDGFYALPFPNDLRIEADGTIDLADYRRPNPTAENYIDAVDDYQRGFSLMAPAFFRFTAAIDPATLPGDPLAAARDDASVYLVVIDPDSPRYGERWPLQLRFEPRKGETIGENWLSVLPYPGFPLLEDTTYAAVVTRRVGAEPAPDFVAIAAASAPSDPDLARARELYQPLWDYLDQPGGDERADVASAAVFTTQDATSIMGRLREAVYSQADEPLPRDIALVQETATMAIYDGVYDAPIFQRGDIPYKRPANGGDIVLDPDTGEPVLQAMAALRFSFTVPLGEPPEDGWPVVIYAHGTGGSYHSYINGGTAADLAGRGIAAISIDQTLHGPRNPDGDPEIDFFNFQNPLAARDNTLQGALDDFQVARMVLDFAFDDTENGRQVSFDSERIFFFGHSQGGLTGLPFVAFEPLVKGAVFSGAGGDLTLSLLNKTEPVDITALVAVVVRDQPLDEFNPLLALVQGYLDRADSAAYGPLIATRPPPGNEPKHVFHSLGLIDNFTPVPSIEALAVSMAVEPVTPVLQSVAGIELAGIEPLDPPVAGNLEGTTAVLLEYQAPEGRDGHFVLFDVESGRLQSIEFLASLAEDGVATVVAP